MYTNRHVERAQTHFGLEGGGGGAGPPGNPPVGLLKLPITIQLKGTDGILVWSRVFRFKWPSPCGPRVKFYKSLWCVSLLICISERFKYNA